MDDDRSRSLSYEEFKKGVHDFGLAVSDEVCLLFKNKVHTRLSVVTPI